MKIRDDSQHSQNSLGEFIYTENKTILFTGFVSNRNYKDSRETPNVHLLLKVEINSTPWNLETKGTTLFE